MSRPPIGCWSRPTPPTNPPLALVVLGAMRESVSTSYGPYIGLLPAVIAAFELQVLVDAPLLSLRLALEETCPGSIRAYRFWPDKGWCAVKSAALRDLSIAQIGKSDLARKDRRWTVEMANGGDARISGQFPKSLGTPPARGYSRSTPFPAVRNAILPCLLSAVHTVRTLVRFGAGASTTA